MATISDLESGETQVEKLGPVLSARWVLKLRHLAVCILLGGMFAYLNCLPLMDSAVWMDVAQGRWMLQQGGIPAGDPAQPLSDGMHIAHTTWLSQVAFALADRWGGPSYVSHLFTLLMMAQLLVLARVFYRQTKHIWLMFVGVALTLAVGMRYDLYASTQVFGYLALALLMWILCGLEGAEFDLPLVRRSAQAGRARHGHWPLWLAVGALFAVWANLHGSYLLGIAILLCYALARMIEVAWRDRSPRAMLRDRQARNWLLLAEWALVASFLNPYGPLLAWENLAVVHNPQLLSMPQWVSVKLASPGGLMFVASVALLAVVLRHSRRKVRPVEVLLLAVFGIGATQTSHAVGWYALVYAFVLVPHLADAIDRLLPRRRPKADPVARPLESRDFIITLVCGLVLYVSFRMAPLSVEIMGGSPPKLEQLLGSKDLAGVVRYLGEHPSRGLIYAPVKWADVLVYFGGPDAPMLMTSNVEWVPRRIWSDHRRMSQCEQGWEKGMDRYAVETMVIDKADHGSLAKAASRSPLWSVAYENEGAVVVRRVEKPRNAPEFEPVAVSESVAPPS